jgi:hypothetical protein
VTVAQAMTAHHIHALVVGGITPEPPAADQPAWGLISDMDLIRAVPAGIRAHTAGEFARDEAVGIEQCTTLTGAASLMINHDPAHLVVTDGGTPIVMVSTLDLAASLALGGE